MKQFDLLKTDKDPIFVYGLGLSGTAVADALRHLNVPLIVWDDSEERRKKFEDMGYTVQDCTHDLSDCSAIIPAAGIPPSNDTIQLARSSNCPIFSDIDLLHAMNPDNTYIGITGTNGKSTATALLGHIFAHCKKNYDMGGNIGRPAAALKKLGANGVYILEMSSYQLHNTQQARFDHAAIINITDDDHLSWHDGLKNYTEAKARILRDNATSVIGIDTPISRELIDDKGPEQQNSIPISSQLNLENGISVINKAVYIDNKKQATLNAPRLPGQHNDQNIAACIALSLAAGLDFDHVIKAIESFEGLEHRQEFCGEIDNVKFINDSKATNASSTERALSTYENIYLIAGGVAKEAGLDTLSDYFDRIKKVYLIGEAAKSFAGQIIGKIDYTECGTMDQAVKLAFDDASQNDENNVVLLSPACASFDQYKNFEARGDDFKAQVKTIIKANG